MKKKIIAISFIGFLSIVMWVFVALSQEFISTIEIPISFSELPKNYSVGSSSADMVYLQLKGKGWELAKLFLGGKEDFIISARRRVGKHKNDLKEFIESNPWLNSHFQVLEIIPSQIEYEVERVNSKKVKLYPKINLEFKEGYAVTSEIKIEPEYVEIFGAPSVLQEIDSIKTEVKNYQNISDDFNETLLIQRIQGITLSTTKCQIEFGVQKIVDKKIESIPIEIRNVPQSKELALYPSKINIVVRGGINKLGKLSGDSIKAMINYWSAIKEENGYIEPEIILPPFVTLISVEPKKIEYIIKQY